MMLANQGNVALIADETLKDEPLWTVREVAALLRLTPETVRAMARAGRLTRYYPGGVGGSGHSVRYDRAEVLALREEREMRPEAAE